MSIVALKRKINAKKNISKKTVGFSFIGTQRDSECCTNNSSIIKRPNISTKTIMDKKVKKQEIFVPGETNRKNGLDGSRKKTGEFGINSIKSSYRTKKIQKTCNLINSNDGLTTSNLGSDYCKCSVRKFNSNITKTTNKTNLQSDYIEKLHKKNLCF